jgi:hypothetical protein
MCYKAFLIKLQHCKMQPFFEVIFRDKKGCHQIRNEVRFPLFVSLCFHSVAHTCINTSKPYVCRYFIVWRVKFNMHRTSKNANCFKTHMNTIPTTVWVSRTNVLSKQSSSISHDNLRTIRIPSYPLIFSLSCTPEEVLAEAQAPGPSSQVITKYLTEVNFYE